MQGLHQNVYGTGYKWLSHERKKLDVQVACTIHHLCGDIAFTGHPLFYGLTKSFYAEDMIDIIEAVQVGKPIPSLDLEEDILHGIMIQFASSPSYWARPSY